MLDTIYQALSQLGLGTQQRAIHIQFSHPALGAQVFLQQIQGQHAINQGLTAELICLSTRADIPLKQFIASQVAIDTRTDRGDLSRLSGIIAAASQGQSDGALTLYKLQLVDPTWLWTKRRNSRVFMQKSVVDVIEILFKEWQSKSSLFASSLQLDLSGLQRDYAARPFIMQSNETDAEFLTRLLRSEAISWLIDEVDRQVASMDAALQGQKLRLVDDNSQYQVLARRLIAYHRSNATELQDSITSLVAERSLQPTAVYMHRWQPDRLDMDDGAGSELSSHQHSDLVDNEQLALEDAWQVTPAWAAEVKAQDGDASAGSSQVEQFNQQRRLYHEMQAKQFTAQSSVRDAQVGYWFELTGHPEIDLHPIADREFLIVAKTFYNQNNLPKDLQDQITGLTAQSQWQTVLQAVLQPNQESKAQERQGQERQGNVLTLQRRNIAVLPEYDPLKHRPTTHTQRARVVGPQGEEIYVDAWGRIKVRFLFSRPEDHQHDAGAGANDNDTDSAWVDVLTPWAGETYGARFLPRIGEIVVIDFFDGDIDRPFVLGRIHEGQRLPTQFDIQGPLPETKILSGIRSKEVAGMGYGQLRFDDSTGQISSQLQSSHGHSQLNLGHLSHPKAEAKSATRGEGFELRTDQWGAVRAGQGLLLSSYVQDQASGMHLDAEAAQQQLDSHLAQAKSLSDIAKNQQTDPLEVLDHLKGFIDDLTEQDAKKAAAFKSAVMLLAAPNSIGLSSHAHIHLAADGQISQTASDSINFSSQKSILAHTQHKISLFAATQGMNLYAAKGNIALQAQNDAAELTARKQIRMISTEDSIEITANKKIVLTAAGSSLEINASGVFIRTNALFKAKAGQHLFLGGEKVAMDLPLMPNEVRKQLLIQYHDDTPVQGTRFTLKYQNGQRYSGVTNAKGIAEIKDAPDGEAEVEFGEDQRPYQVIAKEENSPDYKADWTEDDFENSYAQARGAAQK